MTTQTQTRKNPLSIRVQRLDQRATIPVQAHPGDAGVDLYALEGGTYLNPGQRQLFPTGLALAIPEGHVGLIMPRSGLALKHGIDVLGGVIDSGYRGDVGVILLNTSSFPVWIERQERIAQLVVQPVLGVDFVESRLTDSTRGAEGFGSTGSL